MPLISCEISVDLTWPTNCVISKADRAARCLVPETTSYLPVVALPIQDNAKLSQQLKLGFKQTKNWIKYQLEVSTQVQNLHVGYLINPSLEGINRPFVLNEDKANRTKRAG